MVGSLHSVTTGIGRICWIITDKGSTGWRETGMVFNVSEVIFRNRGWVPWVMVVDVLFGLLTSFARDP